jgi:hypothetical protein
MKSIKAIVAGSLFIIIVNLIMQLIFIFIAVGYNALAKDYPFLNDITGSFRYIIGIPLFTATVFFGGYITAQMINAKVLLHCVAVALIVISGMILPTLENASLTMTGIVVIILTIGGTMSGGWYWQKDNKI